MADKKAKSQLISNNIKMLRGAVGWSQSELARNADVTSAAISQIEKGDRMPSLVVIRKLADALRVSVNELTGDNAPSSNEINSEAQAFFRKFGDIEELSAHDQKLIKEIIKSMKDKGRDIR
jgi:XRE family transcriptional regulator, regulator of sulfur utilization